MARPATPFSLVSPLEQDEAPTHLPVGLSVSVVIPARNEARNIPLVFERLPLGLHEVIVVDGHSTDDTVEMVQRIRPDVRVLRQDGRGKGDAMTCGFAACTGDVIVQIDADGSTDPSEIPRFVQAILDGAEFAKGSRFLPGGGSIDFTWGRRVGNSFLNHLVNLLFGTKYTDLTYGYNAFRASCLESLGVSDGRGFDVEVLMNIRAAKLGLKTAEVPSFEARRMFGESKLHPMRDGLRIFFTILRERMTTIERRAEHALVAVMATSEERAS